MPAAHELVTVFAGDQYLHDFYLTDDVTGVPNDVTGQTFSVKVLTSEYGEVVPGVTATAAVLDGPSGWVRVTISEANTTSLRAIEPRCVLRLRNDTVSDTILSWPVEVLP